MVGLCRGRLGVAVLAVALLLAAPVTAGLGATTGTTAAKKPKITKVVTHNWAGYVAASRSLQFTKISATWTVPLVDCNAGRTRYSSNWVGIGGYYGDALALEQMGTDSDCMSDGSLYYEAWAEVVPAPTQTLKMTVRGGDRVHADVTVSGNTVTMVLRNLTTGVTETNTQTAKITDVTSAEWIVEAPSICDNTGRNCKIQPLARFHTTTFTSARSTVTGATRPILGTKWQTLQLTLQSTGAYSDGAADGATGTSGGKATQTAIAGPLASANSAFNVKFGGIKVAAK